MKQIVFAATLAGLASACALQPVYRQADTPLTAQQIEIDRYVGLWHEAARLPNWFERDCVDATAEYGRRADGFISVLNTCRQADGRTRDAEGRARFAGRDGEGKLKVRLGGPFWADYWVLDRAEDYSWSIVGEPEGRYLWVLTRQDGVTSAQRSFFEQRITELGYRPSDLIWATS